MKRVALEKLYSHLLKEFCPSDVDLEDCENDDCMLSKNCNACWEEALKKLGEQ